MMTLLIVLNWGRRRIGRAMQRAGWNSPGFGTSIQCKFNLVDVFFAKLMNLGKDPI
jgi:hypothetical protein